MQTELPNPPKLFLCEKCQVYFYSQSNLEHPTHAKCTTHKTRIADRYEVKLVQITNKIVRTPKKER